MAHQAIELYRKANRSVDAAKLLVKLAEGQKANPLRAKQLFVLAAMEVVSILSLSFSLCVCAFPLSLFSLSLC